MKESKIGLVQVYTGLGKGKTTAALGQALRAAGQDLTVYLIQFMKNGDYGEIKKIQGLPNIKYKQFGNTEFLKEPVITENIETVRKGFEFAKEIIFSQKYDLVILDEINLAINYGLIKEEDMLELIKNKPKGVELILTGSSASGEIIKTADLVTEMLMIKHPFPKIKARKGIEY